MIDPLLVRRIKNGDMEAFEYLVDCTQKRALNMAYGILNNRHDSEEVVQEAYLQVFRKIKTLNAPEAFNTWFGRIVTHLAFRKAKNRDRVLTTAIDEVDLSPTVLNRTEEFYDQKLDVEMIEDAIKKLPLEYRAALILREWEGYSYQEISEILNIPLGTVKSRIYSARKAILENIKHYEGGR